MTRTAQADAFPAGPVQEAAPPLAQPLRYVLALAGVAVATLLAFVSEHLIRAPTLSLIFVLPVVVSAAAFGWGPALTAALGGVAAFDFFFITPRLTLTVAEPTDVWALSLLLLIALMVSAVAAESRRRTSEARRAADQAEALRTLAHVVIGSPGRDAVVQAAAEALHRLFQAPAVVFTERDGALAPAAVAGGAVVSGPDLDAARWSLESGIAARGGEYPTADARFDVWPVPGPADGRAVLGVQLADDQKGRPREPERLVEIVAAYVAAASSEAGASPRP